MSEISEKAIKLIKDLRRDISIDIMFTPEKNAEDDSLKALVDYIAELEKALNIDADLTVAGLRVELAMATARIAELSQAVGLITTLKPTMVMDVDHPLDMAKEVEAYVTASIAELEAERRWRVVADGELPELGKEVIFYDSIMERQLKGCLRKNGGVEWLSDEGYTFSSRDDRYSRITHWMPLPEPPEAQE